jgi:hypothetical protein
MYYKQDLNKTVQWNTHEMSAGVPVFGFNTKQKYAPQRMDNVLDEGGFDVINPNVFRGKQAKLFSQALGIDQLSAIITQDVIPRINQIQMQYPQEVNSASAKSDTDIWNNINRYIWGKSGEESSPKGDWQAEPNALFPRIKRNEATIQTMMDRENSLQEQINAGKEERDSIQEKLKSKANSNHTHADMSNPLGGLELPKVPSLIPSLSLTTLAAAGIAAYFILGKRK